MGGEPRHGPLHGVRVLDLTTVVMGPSATQILGDLGADVIKVEGPGGDSMRHVGPFKAPAMGPLYLMANRNKRSVLLDLKSEDGMAALKALIPSVDVLVTNIRPQAMERLGLGHDAVAALNPKIITVAAVGYGAGGPDAGKAVYDDLMQATSGIAGLFGRMDGAPRYAPINVCDRIVGLHVVIAVLAALQHRNATGEGQAVEVPMFETMAQFVLADHMGGAAADPPIGPMGYKRLLSRVRGPYPTADGHLAIVVYTDKHWRAFSRMIGQPDLMQRDPRFASLETRTQHAEDMGRFLAEHLPMRGTKEWIALLEEADIPCAPVNSIEDLFEDPHLNAVGLFETQEHPALGAMKVARFPIGFSRSPATIRTLAPLLGEHTDEVLAEAAQGSDA
jgi:crotonobetainyl-CoA:carnitine CoA-transferase CaiB-like acyl-CoA transferase